MKILLGLTGSIACIKAGLLIDRLSSIGEVRVIYTGAVRKLIDLTKIRCDLLYEDDNEWASYEKNENEVLHIELRRWADIYLIAPLSANTLAKVATGLADNLLTCVARAWQIGMKRFIVAPAMNTAMWEHPITSEHLSTLQRWNIEIISPIEKKLFCGDIGMGAMASVDHIIDHILNHQNEHTSNEIS